MPFRVIVIVISAALLEGCAYKDDHSLGAAPKREQPIVVCPTSAVADVKEFLKINLDEKVDVTVLMEDAKKRGYMVDYRLFYTDTSECSDRTLKGTKQYFITVGWGEDHKGSEVFRQYVVVVDKDKTVKSVETRYSYKIH
jgi:hypothetical protein